MTDIEDISEQPWNFDFFDTMRRIEREVLARSKNPVAVAASTGSDPMAQVGTTVGEHVRIGHAATRRDEYVFLGQDPYFPFPASNLTAFSEDEQHRFTVFIKFLGLLGPMGALPLPTTEEAYSWLLSGDVAFPRFLDIFNHRFLQLFFRAWADARPIVQHDCPGQDRFIAYLGSAVGLGSEPFHNLDSVPDVGKLAYAGLLGAKAMSASRLKGALQGLFGTPIAVEEFVGSRLELEPSDQTLVGGSLARLGVDAMLGSTFYSVQDKIRIRIFTNDMAHYSRFLPEGDLCAKFVDMVFFCIGEEIDWDLELAIPANRVQPGQLGSATQLGWTSWLSPDLTAKGYRADAQFDAAERMKQKRNAGPAQVL